MMMKKKEHFSSEGEWIMRHVDPSFGGGGLLIPVVRQGESQQQSQQDQQRQRQLEQQRQQELQRQQQLEQQRQQDLLKLLRTESPATTNNKRSLVSKGESFTAKEGKIMMGSSEIKLRGINWFGMNKTDTNSVNSLWVTPLDEYMQILKDNEFNAVRIVLSAQLMLNLDT
jgi:aspartokinase